MALASRHIDDSGMLRDFFAAFEEAGNEQIGLIGITQNDAGALRGWDDAEAVAFLFVGDRRIFPDFGAWLFGRFHSGAADGEIGIIERAAAGGARSQFGAKTATASAPRSGDAAERKYWSVVAVGGNFFVVTIGNRAGSVD